MAQVRFFNDRHHDGIARGRNTTGGDVPSQFALDVLVLPLLPELRVVRRVPFHHDMIVLCKLYGRMALERPQHHCLVHRGGIEMEEPRPHRCGHLPHQVKRSGSTVHDSQILHHIVRGGSGAQHRKDVAGYDGGLWEHRGGTSRQEQEKQGSLQEHGPKLDAPGLAFVARVHQDLMIILA